MTIEELKIECLDDIQKYAGMSCTRWVDCSLFDDLWNMVGKSKDIAMCYGALYFHGVKIELDRAI